MPDVFSQLLPFFGIAILFLIISAIAKFILKPKTPVGFPYSK